MPAKFEDHVKKCTVAAIVVTFNRKKLLHQCLLALQGQSTALDAIHVIDNASTDGTCEMLSQKGWLAHPGFFLNSLSENTGGAGGFAAGLACAMETAEWLWMMDDDAEPHPDALQELMKVAVDAGTIYGSLAVHGDIPAWTTKIVEPPLGCVEMAENVPEQAQVEFIPFLGFLIHRDMVRRLGFPDKEFFIAADDAEYCLRAQHIGARVVIAGKSRIEHPKSQAQTIDFLGRKIIYLSLAPWKRYYDTRNRLLIAREYHGLRLLTQAIPGTLVRLFFALAREPRKLAQFHAFTAGLIDGLLGVKGKRHEKWGIKP